MTRIGWIRLLAGTFLLALAASPASAQLTSEARIRALMRLAAERVAAAPGAPAQAPASQAPAAAADTRPVVRLSLDDSVRLALERNLDIAVQRLNPQISDIAIASLRAAYHPTLTSTLAQQSTTQAPVNQLQLSQGGAGVDTTITTYNGGLAQSLPWGGGTVQATLNNDRQFTNSNNAFYNPRFQSIWTFSLTQPVLRGFRIDSTRQQLQVTRINRDVSDVQLRASITNTLSNVRNAYWDFVFATEAMEVARQSLELATKLVQDNQTRVQVGTMAPIDVVQAQSEEATRRQALVTAESNTRTTELALKRLIVSGTEDPNWSATLLPTDRPEFRPEAIDVEAAIRRALSERTDLAIAKKNVEGNDVTLKYLNNQLLPQADLQVNYGAQGVGGPFLQRSQTGILGSDVTTIVPGGIADAFSTLFRNSYPRWTVQMNLSYPIGQSAQEAAVARARVQLNQVQAQLKQIELQVATEVTNAAITARNAAESVQAAQAARELSQRRLEAEQSKFEVGMSTNYFVVQAQRDLADAQNSELRAVLDYRKALVELDRVQQTTLQSANITILNAGGGGTTTAVTAAATTTGGGGTGGFGGGGFAR
jgi:outer membrane protein TolC